MNIKVIQKSKQAGTRGVKKWYHWSVHLDGVKDDMARIISVTYHLHPSFPIKEVVRTNRSDGFAFSTAGWGTFTLHLSILWKNDEKKEELVKHEHYLDFSGIDKVTEFELKI